MRKYHYIMSEIDQIIKAAIELQQQGKKPSTALLKVRTQNQFSLPLLINGLKHFNALKPEQYSKWQNDTLAAEETVNPPAVTVEQKIHQLENQVLELLKHQQQLEKRILKLETGK